MKLVSILIATYNRAGHVVQAIETAKAQTYPAVETVVYDDGSTDETERVLSKMKGIRYHREKRNRGVGYARNRLLELAKGEYACWLDSDDMSNRWRVQLQLQALREYGVPFVRTAASLFPSKTGTKFWKEKPYYNPRRQYCCATIMFPTALGRKVRYRTDILLGEDSLWEKRFILQHGAGLALSLTLYHVGRGRGLRRLSQAHHHGQAEEFWRSLRVRDGELVKVIAQIKAAGKDPSRFPRRVPREVCMDWLAKL